MEHQEFPSQEWFATHVRASQYFLQILKCDNVECCTPFRSNLKSILPEGFFPAPLCVSQSKGLRAADPEDDSCKYLSLFQRLSINLEAEGYSGVNKFQIPYDVCCPSVKDQLCNRTCRICHLYFPSNVMQGQHSRALHPKVKIVEAPRTRPLRVAARRQRELMVIIAAGKGNVSYSSINSIYNAIHLRHVIFYFTFVISLCNVYKNFIPGLNVPMIFHEVGLYNVQLASIFIRIVTYVAVTLHKITCINNCTWMCC